MLLNEIHHLSVGERCVIPKQNHIVEIRRATEATFVIEIRDMAQQIILNMLIPSSTLQMLHHLSVELGGGDTAMAGTD